MRRRRFKPQDLLVPVVAANPGPRPQPSELRSPVAPTLLSEPAGGATAARGRVGLGTLPPPADSKLLAKSGAGQPPLYSRVDAARDVRIQFGSGKPASSDAPTSNLPSGVNLTPEPFCRAQRTDQRVSAVGVQPCGVKPGLFQSLESRGNLFEKRMTRAEAKALAEEPAERSVAAAQARLVEYKGPVSGSTARELLSRMERQLRMEDDRFKDSSTKDLLKMCCELQLRTWEWAQEGRGPTKQSMIKKIREDKKYHPEKMFRDLSLTELMEECSARGIDNSLGSDELRDGFSAMGSEELGEKLAEAKKKLMEKLKEELTRSQL